MADQVDNSYRAFLSFHQTDAGIVKRISKEIEQWPIERDLAGRKTKVGPVPDRISALYQFSAPVSAEQPVEDEVFLSEATVAALKASSFLVVFCSRQSAKSPHIDEALRLFKVWDRADDIVPVLIDGVPGQGEQNCIPPAIKFEDEKARIDARDPGQARNHAIAQIVARLLGVRIEEVVQRAIRSRRKHKLRSIAASVAVITLIWGGWFYWQTIRFEALPELSRQEFASLRSLATELRMDRAQASDIVPAMPDLADALIFAKRRANAGDTGMSRALQLLKQGRSAEAEDLFAAFAASGARPAGKDATSRASESRPKPSEQAIAFRNLGAVAGLNDTERAREVYSRALNLMPSEPNALYHYGRLSLEAGEFAKAKFALTKLLETSQASDDPFGQYRAHLHLGDIIMRQGNPDRSALDTAYAHQKTAFELVYKIASKRQDDTYLQGQLAESYDRVGDVRAANGELTSALKFYRDSFAIRERLAKIEPDNTIFQRDISNSHDRIGTIWEARGNFPTALDSYQAAVRIKKQLVGSNPDNAVWQHGLARSFGKIGDIKEVLGDYPVALAATRNGLEILKPLVAVNQDNIAWQQDLAAAYNRVGLVLEAQENFEDALPSYTDSLSVLRQLTALEPSDTGRRFDLATYHNKIGDLLTGSLNNPAAALKSYFNGRDTFSKLVTEAPENVIWQRDLAKTHEKIAQVQITLGALPAALESFNENINVWQRLAEADPKNTDWQYNLASAHGKLGNILKDQEQYPDALVSLETAHGLIKGLVKKDAKNWLWHRDLAKLNENIGDVHITSGNKKLAIRSYRQGVSIVRRLVVTNRNDLGRKRDLADLLRKLGDVHAGNRSRTAALQSYKSSLLIMNRLNQAGGLDDETKKDLALFYNKVGTLQVKRGRDRPDALVSFRASLKLFQELSATTPDDEALQRNISVTFNKIGDALVSPRNLTGAQEAYREALVIAERLATANPKRATWQRDISVSLNKLAKLQVRDGNISAAIETYRKSLGIRKRLVAADPRNAGWRRDLAWSHWRLAQYGDAPEDNWQQVIDILSALKEAGQLSKKDLKLLPLAKENLVAAAR